MVAVVARAPPETTREAAVNGDKFTRGRYFADVAANTDIEAALRQHDVPGPEIATLKGHADSLRQILSRNGDGRGVSCGSSDTP